MTTVYLVDIKHEDSDMIEVDLYLAVGNEEICVNDDLVRKKYAVRKKQDGKNTTNIYNTKYLKKIKFMMLGMCVHVYRFDRATLNHCILISSYSKTNDFPGFHY